jgi:predicted small secreted protein
MRIKLLAAILTLLAVTACANTVDGMGRDIEHAGRGIQDSVK